ncbi:MAG: hypothetical protein LC624_10050 [Halobacteriales archaeon]|nr:hypothetical protein [Halobacteriales archaeon]
MRAALVLASLVLSCLPAAAQDAGAAEARAGQTVTLYGHVFSVGLDAPMPANTFAPEGDSLFAAAFGNDYCGLPGFDDCGKDPLNKRVLFLTAGPVQVHSSADFNSTEDFYGKLHNEHGRAKDVLLDTTKDVHAWFYVAADYHSWGAVCPGAPDVSCVVPVWQWDPGVMPSFVVEATLYLAELGDYGQGASEPPPIADALNAGKAQVLATGKSAPVTLQTGLPGSPNAMEFDVNLGKLGLDAVPKAMDLFLVYSWYEDVNGQAVGLNGQPAPSVKPWSGETFPVRFTLPVRNPVDVELVIPQFVHDKVLVHGVLGSPWGSYDVDVKGVQLEVRDPDGQFVHAQHIARSGDYSVAHGAHFKPVNLTWVWDYKADHARPGTYKVAVTGCDLQHLCASTEASFTINPDGSAGAYTVGRSGQLTASQGQLSALTGAPQPEGTRLGVATQAERATPGPGLGLAVLAIAAWAVLRRRA